MFFTIMHFMLLNIFGNTMVCQPVNDVTSKRRVLIADLYLKRPVKFQESQWYV